VFAQQILPIVVHNLNCFSQKRLEDMMNIVR
jgi:hypothetical protein